MARQGLHLFSGITVNACRCGIDRYELALPVQQADPCRCIVESGRGTALHFLLGLPLRASTLSNLPHQNLIDFEQCGGAFFHTGVKLVVSSLQCVLGQFAIGNVETGTRLFAKERPYRPIRPSWLWTISRCILLTYNELCARIHTGVFGLSHTR